MLALKAALLNLLSLAAAFGIVVFIFQNGHGSALWNIDATHAIDAWIPLMIFAFLFGLSMDYEVFMPCACPALMRLLGRANWWMPSWTRAALRARDCERLPDPATEAA